MTSREKVMQVFNHGNQTHGVMWAGYPHDETVKHCAEAWNIPNEREAVHRYLSDDCRMVQAHWGSYRHPNGEPMFNASYGITRRNTHASPGCFAEAETPADLEKYPWPDVKYFDFTDIYRQIETYSDKMVFTGIWSPFFHTISDFLGMENYFCLMYENPVLVDALTEKVVDFYVEANEKFFEKLGDRADVMFFGNDFGTQRDLIISPEMFRRFILPSMKRLVDVGRKYNKKVMVHSCGSVYRIIPDLIDIGVELLHPIQAHAAGMSASDLVQYKNDLAFVGGIDTQSVFVNATPEEMCDEVKRVYDILGGSIVISPSHEVLLPNVPPANLLAMAQTAHSF